MSNQSSPNVRRTKETRQRPLSGVQFMFAAILAIGMALGISLSSRIASSQPLQEFYEGVETEIADLRLEQGALIAELDYVMSDAYVEQWARDAGKMVRQGEVLVVPVQSGVQNLSIQPTATPAMQVETTAPEPEPWQLWWALFFDSPPPEF